MKKTIRCVLFSLCSISLLFTLTVPIISNYMQGYYKAMISTAPEFLDKKLTWVTIGETRIFLVLFLVSLFSIVIIEMIFWLKNRQEK